LLRILIQFNYLKSKNHYMKKLFFLMVVGFGLLSACKNENSAVRDDARAAIEGTAAATTDPAADPNAAAAAASVPSGPTTTMQFMEEEYNFGTINQGEVVSHTFKFKNTGSEPLIITDAKATCGCTVPKKPTEPIAPGETGELVVEFNSAGKSGAQTKQVTVTANTNPPQSFIRIVSDIKVKDAAAGAPSGNH
jgi:hypothetical protein